MIRRSHAARELHQPSGDLDAHRVLCILCRRTIRKSQKVMALRLFTIVMIGLGIGCCKTNYTGDGTLRLTLARSNPQQQGDGDDWLDICPTILDSIPKPKNWTTEYGQTVGGRSNVIKYTRVPGSVMYYPVWYTGSPEAHSGQTYHKKLGRINSWPGDYDTYSTWRLQTDFYISGVQSEATHWENIRATMGAFAGAASQVDMGADPGKS